MWIKKHIRKSDDGARIGNGVREREMTMNDRIQGYVVREKVLKYHFVYYKWQISLIDGTHVTDHIISDIISYRDIPDRDIPD